MKQAVAETSIIPEGNRLLDSLPRTEREALGRHTQVTPLRVGKMLIGRGKPIDKVFFPVSGVISMVTYAADGEVVEAGTVGREGLAGSQVFLGEEVLANNHLMAQVDGEAVSMSAEAFVAETRLPGPFRSVVEAHLRALMVQMGQGVACNALHSVTERCARWLLQTQDRVRSSEFRLTQEFLGQMLAARRPTVTEVMSRLKADGVLDYHRGLIKVLDRDGLEAASCECYRIIAREHERILPGGR